MATDFLLRIAELYTKDNVVSTKDPDELVHCYYCMKSIPFKEIIEWIDNNETALCPLCGIDAIVSQHHRNKFTDEEWIRLNRLMF